MGVLIRSPWISLEEYRNACRRKTLAIIAWWTNCLRNWYMNQRFRVIFLLQTPRSVEGRTGAQAGRRNGGSPVHFKRGVLTGLGIINRRGKKASMIKHASNCTRGLCQMIQVSYPRGCHGVFSNMCKHWLKNPRRWNAKVKDQTINHERIPHPWRLANTRTRK